MNDLNFYTVDLKYVNYLKDIELKERGFSRVPNVEYGKERKEKFLCGIVLIINDIDYYVPVSSFKEKRKNNFLIMDKKGNPISSLRFNYMFPVPKELVKIRDIDSIPDLAYKNLVGYELRYCIKYKGGACIATSSVTKNFIIFGQKQVEMFANAVETSANDKTPRVPINVTYLEGTDEIIKFMKKRKRADVVSK